MSISLPRTDQVGWYGKLPAFGDFASRRLPQEFIGDFDAWLARSILASREMLGEGWTQAYLGSPIWRFLLPPGVLAAGQSETWAGVMMASVDRVGRHFPFIIAAPFTTGGDPSEHLPLMSRWWAGLEDVAMDALQHDLDGDAVDAELAAQLSGTEPASVGSSGAPPLIGDPVLLEPYALEPRTSDPLALDSLAHIPHSTDPLAADPLSLDLFVSGSESSSPGGLLDDLDFSSPAPLLAGLQETSREPVATPEPAATLATETHARSEVEGYGSIASEHSMPSIETAAPQFGALPQHLNLAASGHSLWSVAPSHGGAPILAMHCVAGMPDVFQFVAMLRTRPVRSRTSDA